MALTNTTAQGAVNMSDIQANFKEVYGDFRDLVPNDLKFINLIKFVGGSKQIGNEYHEPVVISMEGGVTYGGSAGQVYDLNKYVALSIQDAKVKSSEMVLRSAISKAAVSRSTTDVNSFKRGLQLLIGNMMKSMYHRLEVACLYGQDSIGVVETATPVGGDVTRVTIKIQDSDWAAGIWVGTNRHKIDFLSSSLATLRAVPNSGVAYIVDSYSLEDRELIIQGVSATGQAVDISGTTIAPTDKIFFHGEVVAGATPEHLNMAGLKTIAETRGTLFSINNSNIPLFQGNIVDCGTSSVPKYLDFATVEKAAARGVEKGVTDSAMSALVNVHSWNDLLIDQAAKRRYDGSEVGKLKEGGQELEFYGQTGLIKIVPSTFVKEGFAFTFCEKDLFRLGAEDVNMEPNGFDGDNIRYLEDANGYQARAFSDQCLFTSKPGGISVIQYVTNSKLAPNL